VSRGIHTPLVGLAIVAGCGFTGNPPEGTSVVDSSIDVAIADASADGCAALGSECIGQGTKLRVCEVLREQPTDYDCDWGCNSNGVAHCAKLVPAGGYLLPADLDPNPGPQAVTLGDGDYVINTITGEITPGVRAAGVNMVLSGIDFQVRANKVGVFKFAKLVLGTGTIKVIGNNSLALVSLTTIDIAANLDLQGDCDSLNAGPGGTLGGAQGSSGVGSGGGKAGGGFDNGCYGGGGGGNGGDGGRGGNFLIDNGGDKFGMDAIPLLAGGGGGGGGGGSQGADGGGGGGAIQMIAQRRITITGGINVGGCGGKTDGTCGGGGGAAGTILIEAPVIDFKGSKLAANGGGGGGGNTGSAGERASLSNQKANGGDGGQSGQNKGGDGGDGADDNDLNGASGQPQSRCGGGGGGVGRMRFNTLSGTIVTSGTVLFSPLLSATGANTPVTKGVAVTQ
jgi:hypothetical protein